MLKRCTGLVSLVLLLALISGGAAWGAFNPLTDPAIVGWWACDEGEGSTVADSSPNGNDGIFVNGSPVWTTGIHGSAVELKIPTLVEIPAVNITMTAATMAGWIKPYGVQPEWASIMMTRGSATGLNVLASYQLAYHWGDASNSWSFRPSGSYVVNNEWTFAAVTVASDKAVFYVNGIATATNAVAHAAVNWNANIYLGGDGTSGQSGRRMTGALDDVSLFSRALNADEIMAIMAGLQDPAIASAPSPADGATDLPRDVSLAWVAGQGAVSHKLFFGASYDEVSGATQPTASPTDTRFDPEGLLEFGKTYYWRVDETTADGTTFTGDVWSFTAEPYSYPVAGTRIIATASSQYSVAAGPEKTIDGSGMNGDKHSVAFDCMWVTAKGVAAPHSIQYAFDRPCALDRLLVWNSNQASESFVGIGAKNVTVEYSMDANDWTVLGDFEFAQAPGEDGYVSDISIAFGEAAAKYVRLTIHDNWGGFSPQASLSEVRFYEVPLAAREPSPAVGATGITPTATLSWRAGRHAVSHQVYVSQDQQAVLEGTAPVVEASEPTCQVTVDLAATYYWKVVEVNEADSPAAWESVVWSFTTGDSIVVDDFESYTDDEGSRIYESWADGYEDATNGSIVGHDSSPFAEQTIIHGGAQSMPLAYTNTASEPTSKATLTFEDVRDWTEAGVETLSLSFYGVAGNATNVSMWVELADKNKKTARVVFGAAGEDKTALADPAWTEWSIPLSSFAGVTLTRIQSITIGLSDGTGSGTLYFDDIRLYPARETTVVTPVLVGHWTLDNNVLDSSGNGNHGTLAGGPTYVTAGRIGASLNLDGIDDYVNCGTGATLDITDAVTLSAWIKPDDAGYSEHNPFVAKGDTSYSLKHNTGNTIEFFIYDGAWYAANSEVLTVDFNGTWHHVAGTYDGVQLKLYVDGALVASNLHTGDIDSVTYAVNIGRDSQNTDRFYDGQIDDVRIYRGALPKSEVLKLANP
ncbi:MAG TPA: discoidin domain-containing protein [Sedimentisphaerales bacterium]|jgi:hypothetical protein|nr:discoidin domain-containing protein [Sedimentisphaerales bacterium]HNU31337.1 discoidin domain-containing protein [Sedimentisphaerales bacterium]